MFFGVSHRWLATRAPGLTSLSLIFPATLTGNDGTVLTGILAQLLALLPPDVLDFHLRSTGTLHNAPFSSDCLLRGRAWITSNQSSWSLYSRRFLVW